ncbi:MAG: NAD(P)/FAD-dependent oxidoreductase [Lachnospiraceae bacterium]|nr:NAD(P)/FAD-dependent oxidoreductase [Lachnospiraceae bacterium]
MNSRNKKKYDVIVVGAGAAGMMAAISAARQGANVALLEHMEQAGKKLLATGNGKCNFTNRVQGLECYRGQDPAFVLPVLEQFGLSETLAFFQEIGIFPREKRGGYFYPASGQASCVRQALVQELLHWNVDCCYGVGIRSIKKEKNLFYYDTKQGQYQSRSCIIATGGKAAKKTGSDGSGIPYIVGFGHHVTELVPALVQMKGKQSFLKELAGIRADSVLSLYIDGKRFCSEPGELQLTEFGLSGIPAFQVSRYALYALSAGLDVYAAIDFAPEQSLKELEDYLRFQQRRRGNCPVGDCLPGLLNQKLIPVLLREAELEQGISLAQCSRKNIHSLAECIKGLRIDINGSKSFDQAQACAGGVDTSELNPDTMESRLVEGLYFAGEVIDIDGACGGYNLQWAWSSGWVAGFHGGHI